MDTDRTPSIFRDGHEQQCGEICCNYVLFPLQAHASDSYIARLVGPIHIDNTENLIPRHFELFVAIFRLVFDLGLNKI